MTGAALTGRTKGPISQAGAGALEAESMRNKVAAFVGAVAIRIFTVEVEMHVAQKRRSAGNHWFSINSRQFAVSKIRSQDRARSRRFLVSPI